MLGMNIEQIKSIAKPIIAFFGGIAVAKGWISAGGLEWLQNNAAAIIGAVGTLATLVVAFIQNTKAGVLTAAANLPEVQKIELKPSVDPALVAATPSNVNPAQ